MRQFGRFICQCQSVGYIIEFGICDRYSYRNTMGSSERPTMSQRMAWVCRSSIWAQNACSFSYLSATLRNNNHTPFLPKSSHFSLQALSRFPKNCNFSLPVRLLQQSWRLCTDIPHAISNLPSKKSIKIMAVNCNSFFVCWKAKKTTSLTCVVGKVGCNHGLKDEDENSTIKKMEIIEKTRSLF